MASIVIRNSLIVIYLQYLKPVLIVLSLETIKNIFVCLIFVVESLTDCIGH